MQIDFFVPGFSKCGTTFLCSLLNLHPDIYISSEKEPNFFSWNYENGWPWYAQYFSDAKPHQKLGEGSTSYSTIRYEQQAIRRIREHNPQALLIFLARNPIERIESSFREFHHSGPNFGIDTPFALHEAMKLLPQLIDDTKYFARINEVRSLFDDERIHVLFYDDLIGNPDTELRRCFDFLGLRSVMELTIDSRPKNAGDEKLRDSKFLRLLRNTALIGPAISKIDIPRQNTIFRAVGLRRKFRSKIVWSGEARKILLDEIKPDTEKFLATYGKPRDFWSFSEPF